MKENNIKPQLLNYCHNYLKKRFATVDNLIKDINSALESETKSSAGDKHEAGRAMLQLEREKAGNQLAELYKSKEILNKIDPKSQHQNSNLGSLVKTSQANYFIAISAGEFIVEDMRYYAISVATPIAQALLAKQQGDTVNFRGALIRILEIQ